MTQASSGPADFSAPPATPAIVRRETADTRLSFPQESLWFLTQLDRSMPVYNDVHLYRLRDEPDTDSLRKAFVKILERHESLRSVFPSENGQPKRSGIEVDPDFGVSDLPGIEDGARPERLIHLARKAVLTPFDLERGPLVKLRLFRFDSHDHVLLLATHHMIFDAWSRQLFLSELVGFYRGLATGIDLRMPEPRLRYSDYVAWQRDWLRGSVLEVYMSFWKRRLAGFPSALELLTDRPRPAIQGYRGASLGLFIPGGLYDRLKALCRTQRSTPFMALLGVFQVLLSRHSGQKRIVVGCPLANRAFVGLEDVIGYFANTLPLGADLSGNPSFRELLRRVKEVTFAAQDFQALPFEKLVAELNPVRDLSRSPVYQAIFNLRNVPRRSPGDGALSVEEIPFDSGVAGFDLNLEAEERPDGLHLALKYDTGLFAPSTAARLMDHYRNLIEAIVADPDRGIAGLPVMSETERLKILVEWNQTRIDYPGEISLVSLFEDQVKKNPEAAAVFFENRPTTYRQLDSGATRIAASLRELGVGPEKIVGICLDRSPEAVSAILGVLKAGGAFLALDPSFPSERLNLMIEDSSPAVLVTTSRRRASLNYTGKVICLDSENAMDSEIAAPSAAGDFETLPGSLAYIIYTSGSTGRPKGVAVPHKQILNRLHWMWRAYPFGPGEVGCQKTSLSFVDAIWEILGPLLRGIPSVIIPEEVLRDPETFVRTLDRHRVTRIWLVPSLLHSLLDTRRNLAGELPALKFWVVTGEDLSPTLAKRFRAAMPHAVLYNLYGTSEAWDATWYAPEDGPVELARVPIGRPLDNVLTYVLDDLGQPVPEGVIGELHVGGDGLALGYLNQPERTERDFFPNPFPGVPEGRIYRTGDQAYYLPDGNLVFVGRTDTRVKIRGFRVEMGEIEAALESHPAVGAAAVIPRDDIQSDPQLVAYLVPKKASASAGAPAFPSPNEIRSMLLEKLPAPFIPAAFVRLETLPLTLSGKVDRLALGSPRYRPRIDGHSGPPADEVERRLERLWSELLGVETIGRNDNFFELGGHSLLAARLFAEIEKAFGRKLPLSLLFQGGDIEHLADALRQGEAGAARQSLTVLRPGGPRPPLYLFHFIEGGLLGYRSLVARLSPDQPVFGLQPLGLDGAAPFHRSIPEMAAHYAEEIKRFQPDGPYFLGGSSYGGLLALETARELEADGRRVGLLALFDTFAPGFSPFDQRAHRRLAVKLRELVRTSPGEWRVFFNLRWGGIRQRVRTFVWRRLWLPLGRRPRNAHVAGLVARKSYQAKPYAGSVTLFRPLGQGSLTGEDPTHGWSSLIDGPIVIRNVPGDHVTALLEPHVAVLAREVQRCIDEVLDGAGRNDGSI